MGNVAKKTVFLGFRPGHAQTSPLSFKEKLYSWNFAFDKCCYATDQTVQMSRWSETLLDATVRFSRCKAQMTISVVLGKKIAPFFLVFWYLWKQVLKFYDLVARSVYESLIADCVSIKSDFQFDMHIQLPIISLIFWSGPPYMSKYWVCIWRFWLSLLAYVIIGNKKFSWAEYSAIFHNTPHYNRVKLELSERKSLAALREVLVKFEIHYIGIH